ncbi:hypothetical protein V5799_008633 [Amblyomma americanum]|uniref:P450 n=1 Tax=Amblyomma americanum TaxID=6943 RepID=A0AAQ4FEB7_AMBAM
MPGPNEMIPMRTVLQIQMRASAMKDRFPPNVVFMQSRFALTLEYQKEGFFAFYIGTRPCITVYKAEHVETFMTNRSTQSKSFHYRLLHSWLGTGLLTSAGPKWKTRRRMLTPAFHFKILEDFVAPMNRMARQTVEKVKKQLNEPWIDAVPLAASCALDVLLETIMGVSNSKKDCECHDYVKNVKFVAERIVQRSQTPWLSFDWVYCRTEDGRQHRKHESLIHAFTKKVIAKRREELMEEINSDNKAKEATPKIEDDLQLCTGKRKRLTFIDILLRYSIQVDSSLTDDDIREEVDTFMFEGHDTTAMSIAWSLYLIALHPDIQNKVQEELDSMLDDDLEVDIRLEQLKELKYFDRVLKECQRLFPPVPMIGRSVENDVQIGKYTVPKGSDVDVFLYALHRDPSVFPEPEVFDPDRFLPENVVRRHPFAYVPFSAGPRNCIGQKYASMEVKIVIATILRHFLLKAVDQRDQLILTCELVLRPVNGLRVAFAPRSRCT